jgi:U4/U6.U5 tri-snRNP-associated protein 2
MWSRERLKSHVDPHKLVNAIASASKQKFKIGQEQVEVGTFLAWFLHQLHIGTGGTTTTTTNAVRKRKRKHTTTSSTNTTSSGSSIIEQVFQGKLRLTTRQAKRKKKQNTSASNDQDDRAGSDADDDGDDDDDGTRENDDEMIVEEKEMDTNFLHLTLDISEKPLYRDEDGGLVIPQEPLVTVLQKFDGVTFSDAIQHGVVQRRRYTIQQLPSYLILHFARFTSNRYSRVKNPTIVAFPVQNLDLSSYVESVRNQPPVPTEAEIRNMNVS